MKASRHHHPPGKRSWQSVQALRAIAALAIVVFHTWEMLVSYTEGTGLFLRLDRIWSMGAAGVDLFFIISGFIIVYSTREKFQMPKGSRIFLAKRAIRIVPLYWIYSILFLLLVLYPGTLKKTIFSLKYTLLSFLFIPAANPATGLPLPLLPQGWTLSYEVYFYLLFALLLTQKKKFLLPTITLFFGASVLAGLWFEIDNPVIKVIVSPLLLEFVLGCLLAYLLPRKTINNSLCYLLIVMGLISFLLSSCLSTASHYRLLLWGAPGFLLMSGLVFLEKNDSIRIPSLLVKLGNSSYSLYLSHIFVTLIFSTLLKMKAMPLFLGNDAIAIITIITCLVIGHTSYLLVEKKLHKTFRKLL